MDNKSILDKVHKRAVEGIRGNPGKDSASPVHVKGVMEKDQMLRKSVAELYMGLKELNDPSVAIEVLAEHIAIMVEMLKEFKGPQK